MWDCACCGCRVLTFASAGCDTFSISVVECIVIAPIPSTCSALIDLLFGCTRGERSVRQVGLLDISKRSSPPASAAELRNLLSPPAACRCAAAALHAVGSCLVFLRCSWPQAGPDT